MRVYFEADADPALIRGRRVAVIGYGNQGRAQALNLCDSGVAVSIALPEASASRARAAADGLDVMTAAEACAKADVAVMLAADEDQARIYAEDASREFLPSTGKLVHLAFPAESGEVDRTSHLRPTRASMSANRGSVRSGSKIGSTFR